MGKKSQVLPRGLGFRGLGFGVLGLGFRGLGFRATGYLRRSLGVNGTLVDEAYGLSGGTPQIFCPRQAKYPTVWLRASNA